MKLVSWNVQWCLGTDGVVDPRRIVADARAFADFDVLCLQEVASGFPALKGSRGEDQFAAFAVLLPGFAAVPGVAVEVAAADGSRRTFGNMILSRLAVGAVVRTRLPWPIDPAVRSMPRLLLEATVETALGPLRVMTTHLEYYSATQRAAQVEALREHHREACLHALDDRVHDRSDGPFGHRRQGVAAILTGDFNLRADDPLHARIGAPFDDPRVPPLDDVWQQLHPGRPQPATAGVHDHVQWPEAFACDFVFASRDLRPRLRAVAVEATSAASDHQPMLLELD